MFHHVSSRFVLFVCMQLPARPLGEGRHPAHLAKYLRHRFTEWFRLISICSVLPIAPSTSCPFGSSNDHDKTRLCGQTKALNCYHASLDSMLHYLFWNGKQEQHSAKCYGWLSALQGLQYKTFSFKTLSAIQLWGAITNRSEANTITYNK